MDDIDGINLRAMSATGNVKWYSRHDHLIAHEQVALGLVADEVRGQAILDIGVGGGRTVRALRELSDDYLGIDYSQAMIDACRGRYPDARFAHMDARDMGDIESSSIALAVFSCNGISMVGHADRLAILREVARVLRPGGVFLFTTYNRDSAAATAGFRFPQWEGSNNPLRVLKRAACWLGDTAVSIRNRRRLLRHEIREPNYAVINDPCHNFSVMLYYITLDDQRRQLEEAGFAPGALAFERSGRLIEDGSRLDSMLLLARKCPAGTGQA